MAKILYCIDKSSKRQLPLPYLITKSPNIKDSYKDIFPLVIFDEKFLKRRSLNFPMLRNKICFIHFDKNNEHNLKIVKKLGFFDYFTGEDTKSDIAFKLKRAQDSLKTKEIIDNLEKEISNKDRKINKIILVDPTSGCYNWRYFLHRAHQELSRARRHLYKISFITVDIDYFRHINEVYSVRVADTVIKQMVEIIRKCLRKEDILTRWREDAFFIILPYLSRQYAYRVARRIRERIASYHFRYKKLSLTIKVSVGLVSYPEDNISSTQDIINALGKCLINAKRKGGDRVVPFFKAPSRAILEKKKANVDELRTKVERLNTLLTRDLLEMIYGFARAIEAKDFYTGRHVEYTASIAQEIAKASKLPKYEIENIRRAAILHDLGKVGINEKILSKKGPLSSREWEIIKTHPWIATEILREIHSLIGSIPAILYHHERYDGKGYPMGLKGEEIPLSARIVAISDVYQALISDRPYRKAYKRRQAVEIIKKESGKQFDPKVVKMFLRVIKKIK